MAEKMTALQRQVLEKLARRDTTIDGCPSGPELSRMLGHRLRDWATPKLVALEKRGLVMRMGSTFSNAQCWAATPEGRATLEQDEVARLTKAQVRALRQWRAGPTSIYHASGVRHDVGKRLLALGLIETTENGFLSQYSICQLTESGRVALEQHHDR